MIIVTSNPFLVLAPDTDDQVLELSQNIISGVEDANSEVAFITIVSGTWRFAVNDNASNSPATWTSSDAKILLSFNRNSAKIHCKAASAGDTFKIHF